MTTARHLCYSAEAQHPAFEAGQQALLGVTAAQGLEAEAWRAWHLGIAVAALRAAGMLDVQIGRQEVQP